MFWLVRKPYDEPDAIQQVGVFDLMDSRGLSAYNELLAKNYHTLLVTETKERYVQEKKSFDRQGIEIDYSPAQMMVTVHYRIKPQHHIVTPPPPAPRALDPGAPWDEDDVGDENE